MFTAKAMANDGLSVKITPEGKVEFSTGEWGGNPVYADGLVNGHTYEQATKTPTSRSDDALRNAADQAIKHAYDKGAKVALMYDKAGSFHREHIEAGLRKFEMHNKSWRFKAILVVDQHGNLWSISTTAHKIGSCGQPHSLGLQRADSVARSYPRT